MKFKDTNINWGGMMRCCVESLSATKDLEAKCVEGEIVQCRYSKDPSHSWILRNGVWAWNK